MEKLSKKLEEKIVSQENLAILTKIPSMEDMSSLKSTDIQLEMHSLGKGGSACDRASFWKLTSKDMEPKNRWKIKQQIM